MTIKKTPLRKSLNNIDVPTQNNKNIPNDLEFLENAPAILKKRTSKRTPNLKKTKNIPIQNEVVEPEIFIDKDQNIPTELPTQKPINTEHDQLKSQLDDILKRKEILHTETQKKKPSEIRKERAKEKRKLNEKKKRRQFVDFLSGIFVFLLLISCGFFVGLYQMNSIISADGPLQSEKIVMIPKDYGLDSISKLLHKNGVIKNTALFQIAAYMQNAATNLKAGEYAFSQNASIASVIETITEGQGIQYPVTLAEGLTSQQIIEKLKEQEFLVGEIKKYPDEGTLLPNTFNFPRGTTRQQVVDRLKLAQKKVVDEVWAKREANLPIKTKEEFVTLASIVEKETGVSSERPMVAAVFINRLRKGMRLQSDPTIIYGIVGGKGSLGRSITRSDISTKTPYNTYTIDALPPTPIANPGRSALEAVANPAKTNALFFVADGSGGHAFAATLEEHNANVAKWREIEKSIQNESPEIEAQKQ